MQTAIPLKDLAGPVVSVFGALLSFVFFLKNYDLTNKLANRSLILEGQKFVLEIDRQLLSDPHLWGLYDDLHHAPPDPDPNFKPDAPLFQAKLRAFAYLHLNMFEIILTEAPNPAKGQHRTMSNVWVDYFNDTVSRSSLIRSILDTAEAATLWSPVLIAFYENWKTSSREKLST